MFALDRRPTNLVRLAVAAVLVPGIIVAINHHLLRLVATSNSSLTLALVLGAFVVQIGVLGVLAGLLISWPVVRWIVYGWCWLLIDLQTLTAGLVAQGHPWRTQLLGTSLFAAQIGLLTVWGVLGTQQWVLRVPVAAVGLIVLYAMVAGASSRGDELAMILLAQIIAVAGICITLRLQRFRLSSGESDWEMSDASRPAEGATAAAPRSKRGLRTTQFGLRHVLIWTTSLAIVLALLRALDLLSLTALSTLFVEGIVALTYLSIGLLTAIVLVVALWAALGEGTGWLRYPALFVSCAAAMPLLPVLLFYAQYQQRYGGKFWSRWKQIRWQDAFAEFDWLFWIPLAGGLMFASLLIFRTLGHRLQKTLPEHSPPADAGA